MRPKRHLAGGHHRLLEGVEAPIGAGEQARVGLADMADAEGIDEALESTSGGAP